MHVIDRNLKCLKKADFTVRQAKGIMDVLLAPDNGLISKTYFEISLSKLKTEIVKYLLVQFIAILGVVLTIIGIILEHTG